MRWISLLVVSMVPAVVRSQDRKAAADSVHHTDTVHYHYNYSGTGTLNNTNSLHSFVLSNSLKLSMAEKSATVDFANSWLYGDGQLQYEHSPDDQSPIAGGVGDRV